MNINSSNNNKWNDEAEFGFAEPPREAARAVSGTISGHGRTNSNLSHHSELDRFLDHDGAAEAAAAAVGVGVGVNARGLHPYPSLRNTRTTSGSYSSHSSSQQPGAVASAAARRAPSNIRLLPPKKEATPIMPPSLAVEPAMPRPRVSRRFMEYTRLARQPDLAVAKKVKNNRYKAGDDDKHVLKCPNCQSFLKIPKMAVLMQCPTCSTVSPATSSSSSS